MRDSRGRFIKGQPSPRKGVFGVVTSSRKGVPQLDRRGEHPNNWQGGVTKLNDSLRTSMQYRQWRSDVFTRDNFTCQGCGQHGGRLNPHHIKPFSIIIKENNVRSIDQGLACDELWNINNGKTLCVNCHITKHLHLQIQQQSYSVL